MEICELVSYFGEWGLLIKICYPLGWSLRCWVVPPIVITLSMTSTGHLSKSERASDSATSLQLCLFLLHRHWTPSSCHIQLALWISWRWTVCTRLGKEQPKNSFTVNILIFGHRMLHGRSSAINKPGKWTVTLFLSSLLRPFTIPSHHLNKHTKPCTHKDTEELIDAGLFLRSAR